MSDAGQLLDCARILGETWVRMGDPAIRQFRRAVYMPLAPAVAFHADMDWGLYDSKGRNIYAATYRRGPNSHRLGQRDTMIPPNASELHGRYIYLGPINHHYGHFVLASVARLWPLIKGTHDVRFLYHADRSLGPLFDVPFIRDIFAALDIGPERFVDLDHPAIIEELLVPEPSFEEDSFAHILHGQTCAHIGYKLVPGNLPSDPRPLFLSKARLRTGVWNVVNESELINRLVQAGVEIAFPETLSFADQVRIFRTRETVCGWAGSMLHTALFAHRPISLFGLNWGDIIGSSQILVDRTKHHYASYTYPQGTEKVHASPGFSVSFRLANPSFTAEQILMRLRCSC